MRGPDAPPPLTRRDALGGLMVGTLAGTLTSSPSDLGLVSLARVQRSAPGAVTGDFRVAYPRQSSPDESSNYPVRLLQLALAKAGWPEPPQAAHEPLLQGRAIEELSQRRSLRVLWTVSSREREQRLRPVRIPLDGGLIGWRVLLVRKQDLARWAGVHSLHDLARLRGVQGHDWPDLGVLRANGLQVSGVTARNVGLPNLFQMLQMGRVDYFPRGVWEAGVELQVPGRGDLSVEPRLLLLYPSALYFFVHPQDDALADALERGLEAAQRDGSFGALFRRHHCADLKQLQLDQRQLLRLHNPDLPEATPLQRRDLWLQPADVAAWSC